MIQAIVVFSILIYIAATSFLKTSSGLRLVPADIWLSGIILLSLVYVIGKNKILFSKIHMGALALVFAFLVSAMSARYPDRAVFELLILSFSVVGSIACVNILLMLDEEWFKIFCSGYVAIVTAVAAISLIEFFIFPGILGSSSVGGLKGTFRNTGQAGSFFGVHLVICISLVMSGLVPRGYLVTMSLFLIAVALFATLKRASTIGILTGVPLLIIAHYFTLSKSGHKDFIKFVALIAIAVASAWAIFAWAIENVDGMRWRFEYKFSRNALDKFNEGFLMQNINSTLLALAERPFFGVGLDNVRGVYQRLEIHSTYLAVIAYGGLVAVVAYLFFIWATLMTIRRGGAIGSSNVYSRFLYYLLPLFLGLMISWAYTYQLRKREFWILITFLIVANFKSKIFTNESKKHRITRAQYLDKRHR